jgi:hypothetical protein
MKQNIYFEDKIKKGEKRKEKEPEEENPCCGTENCDSVSV